MDVHLLATQFRFYMGIVLVVVSKVFQGKSLILYMQHTFFLFPKMLICPSDIFSSTNIMLLGQVSTLKRCFLLSVSRFSFYFVFAEFSQNKPVVQILITCFIDQKEIPY